MQNFYRNPVEISKVAPLGAIPHIVSVFGVVAPREPRYVPTCPPEVKSSLSRRRASSPGRCWAASAKRTAEHRGTARPPPANNYSQRHFLMEILSKSLECYTSCFFLNNCRPRFAYKNFRRFLTKLEVTSEILVFLTSDRDCSQRTTK